MSGPAQGPGRAALSPSPLPPPFPDMLGDVRSRPRREPVTPLLPFPFPPAAARASPRIGWPRPGRPAPPPLARAPARRHPSPAHPRAARYDGPAAADASPLLPSPPLPAPPRPPSTSASATWAPSPPPSSSASSASFVHICPFRLGLRPGTWWRRRPRRACGSPLPLSPTPIFPPPPHA